MRSVGRKASNESLESTGRTAVVSGVSARVQADQTLGRSGRKLIPRRFHKLIFGLACAGIFGASGYLGWSNSANVDVQLSTAAVNAAFPVQSLNISGAQNLQSQVIQKLLADELSASVSGFDVAEAKVRLEKVSWVKSATVSKTYPDTINIALVEREPFAVWQTDGSYKLIDANGHVLTEFGGKQIAPKFANLPQVVGDGANLNAGTFIDEIGEFPMLASRAIAYVRVGDRRWDLEMEEGVTIKLPEKGSLRALSKVQRLQAEFEILARDLTVIDLRLPDRLVLRLHEEVAGERREQIVQQLKRIKAAELKT